MKFRICIDSSLLSGEIFSDKVFNCLTSITYKARNIFRLELRNFAVGNKTPSASHEQRKNNLRASYVSH